MATSDFLKLICVALFVLFNVLTSMAYATGWEVKIVDSQSSLFRLTGDGKTGVFPTLNGAKPVIGGYNLETGQHFYADVDPKDCTPHVAAYNTQGLHVIGGRCRENGTQKDSFTFIYNPQSDKLIKHPRVESTVYPDVNILAVNSSGVSLVSRSLEGRIYRVEYLNSVGVDIEDYIPDCPTIPHSPVWCTQVVDISDSGMLATNAKLEYWSYYTLPFLGPVKNPYKYPLTLPPDHESAVRLYGISDNDEFAYGLYKNTSDVVKIIVWLLTQNTYLTFEPPSGYSIDATMGLRMNKKGNAVMRMEDSSGERFIGFFYGATGKFYNVSDYTTPSHFEFKSFGDIDSKNNIVAYGMPGGSWATYVLKFVP